MRSLLPLAASSIALMGLSTTAHAGGVGLMGTTGFRQVPAYYYNSDDDQGIDWQSRPSSGFGIDAVLGDLDNRIMGVTRFYWLVDAPATTPDLSGEDSDEEFTHPDYDELDPVNIGVASIGIQWGVWGDPTGFQVILSTMAGTGFITSDTTEFFLLEPGAGVTWTRNERIQVFGTAGYQLRYRKAFSQGANVTAGVRYLFD